MSEKNGSAKKAAFGTVQQVLDVCSTIQDANRARSLDRAKIDGQFNGERPYSEDECKRGNVNINVNWGEGKRIMSDANAQINNATIQDEGYLFTAALEEGPQDKRQDWSMSFTKNLMKPIQRGRSGKRHNYLIQNRNASTCMHGIGAMVWGKPDDWMPKFIPLEDLLIPTDTLVDFSNVRYFGTNLYLSPGEFEKMTQGKNVKKGWNRELCKEIVEFTTKNVLTDNPNTGDSMNDRPEYNEQLWKQKGFWYSDAVQKIKLRAFYWQDVTEPQAWHRHIVLRDTMSGVSMDQKREFIYDGSDEVFASHIEEILYCLYADGNLVPPLTFHSARGLGTDLYAPVEILNRYRCQFMQHCFEQLLTLFRIQDPADRDRLKNVMMSAYGFIPEGLNFVNSQERHQIDPNLAAAAMGQMKAIMQDQAASFVQDDQNTSGREMTAREATIKLNQANMMVSSMLRGAYRQEGVGYYTELVRRFCKKGSTDAQVVAFQEKCIREGIPAKYVHDHAVWRVSPEKVFGGGDRTQAQLEADWLFKNRTAYDATAQRRILRDVTGVMLNNPQKAKELVPDVEDQSTEGSRIAEDLFGTLMAGGQCGLRTGFAYEDYVIRMETLVGQTIKRIESVDNMGTMSEFLGLANVLQNVQQYLQVLSQDQAKKQLTKQLADVLAQETNAIKAFGSRIMEQQQANDPEMLKAQTDQQAAKQKMEISAAQAEQKMALKQQSHDQKSRQSLESHELQTQTTLTRTQVETQTAIQKTMADVQTQLAKTEADIKSMQAKTAAQTRNGSEN